MCPPATAQFASAGSVSAMIGSRGVDKSRATLKPFTTCGQLTLCLRHSLVRAYGIHVLTLNSNFYSKSSGVSGLTWRSWFLDKLITCITGGSRKRTMGTRNAISVLREAS